MQRREFSLVFGGATNPRTKRTRALRPAAQLAGGCLLDSDLHFARCTSTGLGGDHSS